MVTTSITLYHHLLLCLVFQFLILSPILDNELLGDKIHLHVLPMAIILLSAEQVLKEYLLNDRVHPKMKY